jgi:hypothetical protein
MPNWIVLVAAGLIVPALILFLATKSWLPRVGAAASGIMAMCLGILALWAALDALEKGVFESATASKILSRSVYRTQSPGAFWMYFTSFALPGLLLVTIPSSMAIYRAAAWLRAIGNKVGWERE